jgi:hypothetical protein
MKYKNQTLSLSQIIINHRGIVPPLCNTCKTRDCEYIVEEKKVSLMGVNHNWKVITKGGSLSIVMGCEGYSN